MRILVDARVLERPWSGVGLVAKWCTEALQAHGHTLTLIRQGRHGLPVPIDMQIRSGYDAVLFPWQRALPLPACRRVRSIFQDVGFLAVPNLYQADEKTIRLTKKATRIPQFAISDFTAREIHRLIPAAATTTPLPLGALEWGEWRPSKSPYLLYVAADRPHKRIDWLLRIWARRDRAGELHVVTETDRPPQKGVIYLPRLSSKEVDREFEGASAYVHVSAYEGLGLPVLRAAASGLPVVATRSGAPDGLMRDVSWVSTDDDLSLALDVALRGGIPPSRGPRTSLDDLARVLEGGFI